VEQEDAGDTGSEVAVVGSEVAAVVVAAKEAVMAQVVLQLDIRLVHPSLAQLVALVVVVAVAEGVAIAGDEAVAVAEEVILSPAAKAHLLARVRLPLETHLDRCACSFEPRTGPPWSVAPPVPSATTKAVSRWPIFRPNFTI